MESMPRRAPVIAGATGITRLIRLPFPALSMGVFGRQIVSSPARGSFTSSPLQQLSPYERGTTPYRMCCHQSNPCTSSVSCRASTGILAPSPAQEIRSGVNPSAARRLAGTAWLQRITLGFYQGSTQPDPMKPPALPGDLPSRPLSSRWTAAAAERRRNDSITCNGGDGKSQFRARLSRPQGATHEHLKDARGPR